MAVIVVTVGTVLALPGDVMLFTSSGFALGTEQPTEIIVPEPPEPPALAAAEPGKYRPLTWPSYGRPWRQ